MQCKLISFVLSKVVDKYISSIIFMLILYSIIMNVGWYESLVGQSSEYGETKVSKLSDLVDHEEHAAKCQLPNHSESGRVSDDRYGCQTS